MPKLHASATKKELWAAIDKQSDAIADLEEINGDLRIKRDFLKRSEGTLTKEREALQTKVKDLQNTINDYVDAEIEWDNKNTDLGHELTVTNGKLYDRTRDFLIAATRADALAEALRIISSKD